MFGVVGTGFVCVDVYEKQQQMLGVVATGLLYAVAFVVCERYRRVCEYCCV